MSLPHVILKKGRDGPVRGRNPWIFSQAIQRIDPAAIEAGTMVEVLDHGGEPLGAGHYHPATTIAVRMLGFGRQTDHGAIVPAHLAAAIELRRRIVPSDTTCMRLVNGDGDGLSGLVVDQYGDVLVMQLLTAGMERLREALVPILLEAVKPRSIIERSAGSVRREEGGLADRSGPLAGESPRRSSPMENGLRSRHKATAKRPASLPGPESREFAARTCPRLRALPHAATQWAGSQSPQWPGAPRR